MKRRQFLQNTSLYAAGALIVPASLKAAKGIAANEKINIGAIGINGMGWADVRALLKNPEAQLVALCDVDQNVLDKRMAELAKENIKPVTYGDYRKLDRPHKLEFTLSVPAHFTGETEVVISIVPQPGGCYLDLTQTGVPTRTTEKNWRAMLEKLDNVLKEMAKKTL